MNRVIQTFLFAFALLACGMPATAQKMPGLDASPHDISYFREERNAPPIVKVLYGRPQMKGRKVAGELIPFGQVWRAGANEATEIRFYKEVTFGDKAVKAGTYTLFVLATESKWTIILNKDTDVWGAYTYNAANDVARTEVAVGSVAEAVEAFAITFVKGDKGNATMVMAWDKTKVEVPIKY